MTIAVFIQARMGSTRLPGKVLMQLGGKSVLSNVLERVKASGVGEPIVVTTLAAKDIPIVRLCVEQSCRVFCGSEDDVLDRFWQAAKLLDIEHVVRITADCPILDPQILAKVVNAHLESGADYTSNAQVETYPDGLDVEVIRRDSLEKAWKESTLRSEREHVTPYIRKNPQFFRQCSVENIENLSAMRWTLDTEQDFAFLTEVYRDLDAHPCFGMDEVLGLLRRRPEITVLNEGIVRNEGYLKSLQLDQESSK